MKKSLVILLLVVISGSSFAQSITEVLYPLYVQGVGNGNPPDDRKVPFVCRMQINGLNANATYRYYSRFGNAPTGISGTGFYIIANKTGNFTRTTAASLAAPGAYGEFTTDATGSVTDWFIIEPSSAIDFAPGNQLYWRIFLNNGAGGGAVATRITNPNPVTVLGWGTAPNQGTGLRITPVPSYTAKDFVMLFDNEAGAGRPVTGSFIESDGTLNSSALNGDPFTTGYAPFYGNNVDGVEKTWGTIIPNNLPTGVRNITQYRLTDGGVVFTTTTPDGVYPTTPSGTISTANTNTGLAELVIDGSAIVLPVTLKSFTATLFPNNNVKLQWATEQETSFSSFVVEKSATVSDFTAIGQRDAKGNNSTYTLDDVLKQGITYYRLKMIDTDGKFKYSDIIKVNGKASTRVSVYPNPVSTSLTVSHAVTSRGARIQIFSSNGANVATQSVPEGSIQNTVDVSRFAAGKYVLILHNDGSNQQVQFNKL